jgi:hypothetical protein
MNKHPNPFSRRQFLKRAGLLAAGAGPLILSRFTFGATADGNRIGTGRQAAVETHPAVQGEAVSQDYTVAADGQPAPVYTAPLDPSYNAKCGQHWNPAYSFASFEFSGRVTVSVTSAIPLTALSVRPAPPGISIQIEGNTATFTLERPGNFVIERNHNGRKDPLLLFANPVETERPRPGAPGVIYYGPGRHNAGIIHLADNQTLYIAGGAVVTGAVIARGDNIKILGRGLLENSGKDYERKCMILLDQCTRARVEGITIRKESRGWTLVPMDCDGVAIANVKICGSYRPNDDGMDPVNTRNMTIEDCFIRTKDDCLAFKGKGYDNHNCENITVTRTSLWSDQCAAMLFGDESQAGFMRNIRVMDCHVLYLSFRQNPKKLLVLHACERMRMENLRFENIDVYSDGPQSNYIEMTCEFNKYNKKKVPGFMRNIVLKDVALTARDGPGLIILKGFNDQYDIDGVTFDHCTSNGTAITRQSPNVQIGKFAGNIQFVK